MDYEYTLVAKKGLKIYKIPPMDSNQGYYLDSWKREDKITEVNMKVVAKGHEMTIQLLNPDNTLFAMCPLPFNHHQALIKCVDSSRGYGVRLVDPRGKFMWVGMSFGDRNDSFDFHTAIEDFEEKRDMELNPGKYQQANKPEKDFTLKKGEKISFNVGGNQSSNTQGSSNTQKSSGMGLLPPPGSKSGTANQGMTTKTENKSSDIDLFGGFSSSNNNGSSMQGNFGSTQSTNFDFGSFGNFGSNSGTQQQQQQQQQKSDPFDFFNFGSQGNQPNQSNQNQNMNNFFDFSSNQSNNTNNTKQNQGSSNSIDLLQ